MDLSAELKAKGWNLSKEGLEVCKVGLEKANLREIVQNALNMDLRNVGGNFFPEDMKGAKLDFISGSGVVQIQKIKNATAPKYEYGSGAPPILRLLLTDGNTHVNCLQWGQWKSISMDTPPGTKIFLKPGKIPMQNSFMLLSEHQFTVLGGFVDQLVSKWELNKSLAHHVRTKENLDGSGPPPWIPFGKPINAHKVKAGNFRSLELEAKEAKEDAAFKQQRLANIAEVSKAKEGKAKVFGGGKELPNEKTKPDSYQPQYNSNDTSGQNNRPQRNYNDPESRQPQRNDDRNRNGRGYRNDSNWQAEEVQRQPGTPNLGQFFNQDKRLDQRNKYNNSDKFQNPRNQGSQQQQRPYENSYREDTVNASRKFQRGSNFNEHPRSNDRYHNSDRRSNDIEDLAQRTSQVKLHGYDMQSGGQVCVPSKPFLKPGTEVNAKYWEDNRFYRATVHAVGKEGRTCVVYFLEYGNYEEVLVDDVQPLQVNTLNSGWNAGPISFQPSHWEGGNSAQDFPAISEFQHNSNRPQNRRGGHDRQRNYRQDHNRPSARLYQPPPSRN
ncbi:hypothetical protein JTE90_003047 [Oedothorax gibbosus]|uniref:Tudor domain-containing protein n=1 Tax=Oedothorax gibbosus TaxID=931172 RepID=A0AAV6VCM4_9ARAC|nr:hypothetical protein JTE90_003047 [Oedothorax gibbosus]